MRYTCGLMAANGDKSSWLDTFLKLERTIGERVEEAVTSDAYYDLVAQATRARKRVSAAVESIQEEWLHLLNLPAGTDVRRLREQVSRLERELEALTLALADKDEAAGETAGSPEPPKPRPRRPRPPREPSDSA
jgi:hypothetical protein